MNDPKIREHFKKMYLSKVGKDAERDIIIVDELGIMRGDSIADLAAITPHSLECYEIKSGEDTLYRLPKQMENYNQVFDYITLITEEKYLTKVEELVSPFWGIILAKDLGETVHFTQHRNPTPNLQVDKRKVSELLWKNEMYQILHKLGVRGISTLSRPKLWDLLCQKLELPALRTEVFINLRRRVDWKEPI
jgi:hypothetical protein